MKRVSLQKIYTRLVSEILLFALVALVSVSATDAEESDSLIPISTDGGMKQAYYLSDKDFQQLYSLKEQPINDTCPYFAYEECQMLMKIARSEGGEDLKAQALIMRVVLNRVISDDFPDTIQEVIYQDYQFSAVSDGNYDNADVNANSHLALAEIEKGWDESDGALFFEASWLEDSWQSQTKEFLYEYEGTKFYK